jgi:EpsI family protein
MKKMNIGWGRFAAAMVLLLSVVLFLQARKRPELTPPSEKLAAFPSEFNGWTGRDVPIPQETLDVLKAGDTLERVYTNPASPAYVDLFIGYFPTQRTGAQIHSPKNCLPGAGWAPVETGDIAFDVNGQPIHANRYVIGKGNQRNLVLYWYQSHGRAIASEYSAKAYLVADSIRLNRTDAALVRVITPFNASENPASAEARAVGFAREIVPQLPRFIPN